MNRQQYAAERRAERASAETRADRGLPHHPTGRIITCPACLGMGGHDGQPTPRFSCDPADDDGQWIACRHCDGDGCLVDGWRDPLASLHHLRRGRRTRTAGRVEYGIARRAAYHRPLGFMALVMVESAIRCDLAARAAVQAWRTAA